MPAIISTPARTRTNSRGLQQDEVQQYIDLMVECDDTQSVSVDDSTRDNYEASYARGERIRVSAVKFAIVPEGKKVSVAVTKGEDEKFTASVRLVDAPKVEETKKSK